MGTFRCGLLTLLTAAWTAWAQDPNAPLNPAGVSPSTVPGLPATVAPELDPNIPATIPAPGETNIIPADISTTAPAPVPAAPKRKVPPKKVAPALPTTRGTVAKLDNVAMTLTVDAKGKEHAFKVTSKTRIFADGKPGIFGDGKLGENVTVEYRAGKDQTKEALSVRFGGSPASAKASAKPAARKARKPAPVPPPDASVTEPIPGGPTPNP